jgi:hypothetical protein
MTAHPFQNPTTLSAHSPSSKILLTAFSTSLLTLPAPLLSRAFTTSPYFAASQSRELWFWMLWGRKRSGIRL